MAHSNDLELICKVVTDTSDVGLIAKINAELQMLNSRYEGVWVVSISHDVTVFGAGTWSWSALITCEVTGEKNGEAADHEG